MSAQAHSIAIVDDDESMCHALSRLLRASGYWVRTYFSAEAFLDDPEHEEMDFLVLDIGLRGMSGLELLKDLRGGVPALPVAFITAQDDAAVREQARTSGCVAFLRKPFVSSDLLQAIHSALGTDPLPQS